MNAIVQNAYSSPDLLEFKEVEKPVVGEYDVLVRVYVAGLNAGDYFTMRGRPWMIRMVVGLRGPDNHIPGWDVAGTIEAVGPKVTMFQLGDEVYGAIEHACAEYACASEDKFALKPASLTMAEAAAVPTAASTALKALRDMVNVQPGQKVLINGASGGVGTFAVQIAKVLGAEVTGICSTRNVEMVRSIGADNVIDYTREDFTKGDQRYDVVLDNVGNHSFAAYRRVLTPQGIIQPNTGHAGMWYVIKAAVLSQFMRQQGKLFVATPNHDDLVIVKEYIDAGKVAPVMDRTYPFNETVEALRYLEKGHARGKVVITVAHDSHDALREVAEAFETSISNERRGGSKLGLHF
ncbi:NAD(P)-dependent alcohol dehydrogenase [Chloroflexi bacterium TSY]|nr:NAD(P)-dependent alcohol dehydrogenase [Chloroflexi bacterium TSY]